MARLVTNEFETRSKRLSRHTPTVWTPLSISVSSVHTTSSSCQMSENPNEGGDDLNEDELLIEIDDDDEIEYDYSAANEKMKEWCDKLDELAKTTSKDENAVAKSRAIFDEMFETYVTTEDSTFWPKVDVYNKLIEIHAYSKSNGGGNEAEKILSRMEDQEVTTIARPNLETYLNVIDAWAMRKNVQKANAIVERVKERYQQTLDEAIKPNTNLYNKLIKAHGMAGNIDMVHSIFGQLCGKNDYSSSLDIDPGMNANLKTYIQVMKAYASVGGHSDRASELFQQVLHKYEKGNDLKFKPNTEFFNSYIRVLANDKARATEAETWMYEMIEQFQKGNTDVRPNANTFRNVIKSHMHRVDVGAGVKMEGLLQLQEGLYQKTKEEDLKVDVGTYNAALRVIARSNDRKKAFRAGRLLQVMNESAEKLNEPPYPNSRTYYCVLQACAHTSGDPEDKMIAFQIALDTLNELQDCHRLQPAHGCYGMFLRACSNLMPPSRKRDAVAESIFERCCEEGLVSEFVFSEFAKAASEGLQLEILGGFIEDGVRIPEPWNRNVPQKGKGGRQKMTGRNPVIDVTDVSKNSGIAKRRSSFVQGVVDDETTGRMETKSDGSGTMQDDQHEEKTFTENADNESSSNTRRKEELEAMTVVELKRQLRDAGLQVSGKKEALINRLLLAG